MKVADPKYGFYFTCSDVENAKENIASLDWAGKRYEYLKQICDKFLAYPDSIIYKSVLSMKDQVFAYGISGCPHCKQPFPMDNEQQRSLISSILEFPVKKVRCPHCGSIFPNEKYPDRGQGLKIGKKAYYLIGMWNFFHAGDLLGGVRDHEGMVTKLTYMYMLTGDESYAHKALVILDAFSAIYKGSLGPRDFTPYGSNLDLGRLHMLTSIVFRVKVFLAQDYDWLYKLKELDDPSVALGMLGKKGTIRQNIEGMLNEYLLTEPNGTNFNLEGGNLSHLQNHESDGVRAMLAVGLVLDNKDYCKWSINAVEAYLYNAIGRDGMYYEGSFGYSLFTGTVFLDIALLASRASSIYGIKGVAPFDCDRFFRYLVNNPVEMLCQGHIPSYGDWGSDNSEGMEPSSKILLEVYRAALYFYQFTTDSAIREESKAKLLEIYPLISVYLGDRGIDLFFKHLKLQGNELFKLPQKNTFMGQCGIGILRAKNNDTVLMRVGQNNTHSHDDVLAYNYYSCGKEISADIGYSIYGTNAHYGWSSKSVAHNTVVVNEDETMGKGQLYKPFSGGEFSFIYESEYLNAFEGKAPELFNIDKYQRMICTASIDERSSYVIDFFYIKGAKISDYVFHAFHENSTLQLEMAEKVPADHWTLAGISSKKRLYFDAPGKSFGERLTTGETFSELLKNEKAQLWTPDKNNGYGYIYNINEYKVTNSFYKAKWLSERGYELILNGLYESNDRVFTGLCPNLDGSNKYPVLIQRSYKPEKQFVSVVQTKCNQVEEAEVLSIGKLSAEGQEVTAIAINITSGQTDFWIYSPHEQRMAASTPFGQWITKGRCGWIRTDENGCILESACVNAEFMEFRGKLIRGRNEEWNKVIDIDIVNNVLFVEKPISELEPKYILARESEGQKSSLYAVKFIERCGAWLKIFLKDSLVLSKGIVKIQNESTIETVYPLPLGVNAISPFNGRKIIGEYGGCAVIRGIKELKKIEIDLIHCFKVGERFDIIGMVPGYEVKFL